MKHCIEPCLPHCDGQRHVHEVQGSVEIAEPREEPHNHRFATVSGEAIQINGGNHVHEVTFRTDFYENHFHEFSGKTCGAIPVGDRHVHFMESVTTKKMDISMNLDFLRLLTILLGINL